MYFSVTQKDVCGTGIYNGFRERHLGNIMNKKTKLFLLMNIGNYMLVLLAFLGFRLGAGISIIFLLCQLALVVANYFVSQKIWQLALLSVHLLISTIIANLASVQLYFQFVSSDSETLLVGRIELLIGIIFVIIISVIAIIIASLEKLNSRKK